MRVKVRVRMRVRVRVPQEYGVAAQDKVGVRLT